MVGLNLNYNVQITENFSENGEFIIKGTAINATTTDNGHTFLVEELRPSASSLTGVPLLIDHNNTVDSIKGKVLSGSFNEAESKVDFRAKVVDEKTQKLIVDGLLNTVSVGANVREITEGDNGDLIARGIKFKELSLVAVPADDGATFGIAMMEAYNSTKVEEKVEVKEEKSQSIDKIIELEGGQNEMDENNDFAKFLEEFKSYTEKTEVTLSAMKEQLDAMKVKEAEVKEADADEQPEAPAEEEAKPKEEEAEEEEEEEVEESTNIIQGNGSIRGSSYTYTW